MAMKAEFRYWTPQQAQTVLNKNNINNRAIRRRVVEAYADMMRIGTWDENSLEPIVINKDGRLENGQHRLYAVLKSGKTVRLFTVTGSEPTYGSFDRGAPRNQADALRDRGLLEEIGNLHIATANFMLMRYGLRYARNDDIVEDYIVQNERNIKTACLFARTGKLNAIMKKAFAVAAVYEAVRFGYDGKRISDFCRIVNTGFYDDQGQTGAVVLRNMILNDAIARTRRDADRILYEGFTAAALMDFINGRPRKRAYKEPYTGLYDRVREMDDDFIKAHK